MAEDRTFWGVHAGATGNAHHLFLNKKVVALGWSEIGDLSTIPANRDAFKEKYVQIYPETKKGAIPVNAGQLFRYVHEMKIGDIVIYPSKNDRQIHIGEVTGDYMYVPKGKENYPHQRNVTWLKHCSRTEFSQGALYEIGSAMTLFQVKNYADEYEAAMLGKQFPEKEIEADDVQTFSKTAAATQQSTEDFVIKKLSRDLKGHPFASFVAHLLDKMGYNTRVSPEGPDGGIDIIAHRDELGFEPPIIKVQVKSKDGNIGDPEVSALYGKVDNHEFGMLVNLGGFTRQARDFARNKSNLRLIDGEELVQLIFKHYEDFDSKYKGILPLKRVYVPELPPEDEE